MTSLGTDSPRLCGRYLISMVFLLKYGVRMMRFSKHMLPAVALRRLVLLCTACSVTFLMHALYYGGVATAVLRWKDGYPPGVNAYVFDALFYPLLELCPSLVILVIIFKRRPGHHHGDGITNPYSVGTTTPPPPARAACPPP